MLLALLDLHAGPDPAHERIPALARAAEREGFSNLIVCREGSLPAEIAASEGLPLLVLRSGNPFHPLSLLRLWLRLRGEPHVLFQSFGGPAASLARLLAARRRPGRSLTADAHFFEPRLNYRGARKACAAMDCVICGSSAISGAVLEASGIPPGRVHVIPPGTNCRNWPPRTAGGRFVIGMLGPLEPGRGQEALIQAMAALWQMEDLPPWEVRLIGSGPMFDPLLEEARKLGVADRLALLGDQDPREVLPLCSALVLPAGMWVYAPLLAAGLASGLPVLCPDNAAAREAAHYGENIFFTAEGEPQALAAAVLRLIREPSAHPPKYGGNAPAWLGEERMVADCFALYREMLARRGLSAPYVREKDL